MSTPTLATPAKPEVSKGITGGKLLRRYEPIYPPSARALRLGGAVSLKATVDKTGKISNVIVLSGNPLLTSAAVDAVKRWRYQPFELNGTPVEVENTITFNFQPPLSP
jgi:protein TonB